MNVLVVGPESSGGRYISRCLAASDQLHVLHWSMPHGPSREDRFWPDERDFDDHRFDVAVLTLRNWDQMVLSASNEHTNSIELAESNARLAIVKTSAWLTKRSLRWRTVSYEALSDPDTIPYLFHWIGVPAVAVEEFIDGNSKWLELD